MAALQYMILQHPGHNRVYFKAAEKLAQSELEIAAGSFRARPERTETVHLAGIRYLSLQTSGPLAPEDLRILSELSFFWALFRLADHDGKPVLVPVETPRVEFLDGKIGSLLKYQGKTNELFTRMMINVGRFSGGFPPGEPLHLLDPVAGRGTTLFQAGILGMHAYGIERDGKQVHDTAVFFKKYLETERWKHVSDKRLIGRSAGGEEIRMVEFEYARTREALKGNGNRGKMGFIAGDATETWRYFKKARFHLLVGDLPYGIHHGARSSKKPARSRGPEELLSEGLAEWKKVLVNGGAVVVSWNTFVTSRDRVRDLFELHGFRVLRDGPYDRFEHMVDRSIKRNMVVALKPGPADKAPN